MKLKDSLLLAHSQVIMSRTSPGSEPVIFWPGSLISHERLIRDSVGGASVNGNIIKRPLTESQKGLPVPPIHFFFL